MPLQPVGMDPAAPSPYNNMANIQQAAKQEQAVNGLVSAAQGQPQSPTAQVVSGMAAQPYTVPYK